MEFLNFLSSNYLMILGVWVGIGLVCNIYIAIVEYKQIREEGISLQEILGALFVLILGAISPIILIKIWYEDYVEKKRQMKMKRDIAVQELKNAIQTTINKLEVDLGEKIANYDNNIQAQTKEKEILSALGNNNDTLPNSTKRRYHGKKRKTNKQTKQYKKASKKTRRT